MSHADPFQPPPVHLRSEILRTPQHTGNRPRLERRAVYSWVARIAGILIPKARNRSAQPSLQGRNSCQHALQVRRDAGRSGSVCSLDGRTLSQASPRAFIVADRQPAQVKGGQTVRKGALNSPYGEQEPLI